MYWDPNNPYLRDEVELGTRAAHLVFAFDSDFGEDLIKAFARLALYRAEEDEEDVLG